MIQCLIVFFSVLKKFTATVSDVSMSIFFSFEGTKLKDGGQLVILLALEFIVKIMKVPTQNYALIFSKKTNEYVFCKGFRLFN